MNCLYCGQRIQKGLIGWAHAIPPRRFHFAKPAQPNTLDDFMKAARILRELDSGPVTEGKTDAH